MPVSRLFCVLVLLGIVPVIVGSFIGVGFISFLLYNALLLILLIMDIIMTPSPKMIEPERICEDKLSMGTSNTIVLKVRNNSGYYLDMELTDEVPMFFKLKDSVVRIKAEPHDSTEGSYAIVPEKRGEYLFGRIHCRYKGLLRLCVRTLRVDAAKHYKVYPNLKDLRKYNIAALKKSQLMLGNKRTKVYGSGTEFESLKEYSEGDDYRKINWMSTARAGKLMVNTYQPEKNQQIFVLLDCSRVMNSEINYIKKLDYAINSSFLLADFAIRRGDNTGLLVFDSNVRRYVKPGKGMKHFQLIADNLYNVEENFVTADYAGALTYLNEHRKRRSLLCIFTELFNVDEAVRMIAALKGVAGNHIPLVITIRDMRIYDMVNSEIHETRDLYDKTAAIRLIEEREKIKRLFNESGIACMDVPPDQLNIEVLNKYIAMKSMMQI